MKAYVLHDIDDFRYEEIDNPVLEEGTVLVQVKAAGICGSDIPRVYRTGTYSYPLIPGHEFSGSVVSVGAGVDASWIGKRVGVFPLIPCKECSPCCQKKYEMCKNYSYLGSRCDGGFAEYVKVPVWNLVELPDNVSFEQAAMLEPMAVAVHAIRRSHVESANSIAICGMGTIGLLVAMFLWEMGCRKLYVVGNKDFQRDRIEKLGIPKEDFFDIRFENLENWVSEKTNGEGVDVFFDCVGKNEVLTQGINSISAGGTLVLVGNPVSDVNLDKNTYWKILRRQLSLVGTWNSSFTHEDSDDWNYVLEKLSTGAIHPEKMITHKFSFDELRNGFELMRDKTEDYVKVMGIF